jgi:cbb3-type cytochrome oxidase subunit 3
MDANTTVKLIAGVLCLILVAIIFLRKKARKKADEEEF